eukprot:5831620-Pleurochrysis_carterae.AAC.2
MATARASRSTPVLTRAGCVGGRSCSRRCRRGSAGLPSWPASSIALTWPPRRKTSPPPRLSFRPHENTSPALERASVCLEAATARTAQPIASMSPLTRSAGPSPLLRPSQPRATALPPHESILER